MNQRSVFADPSAMVVLDRSTEQPRRQMKVSTRLIVALMTKFNVWSGGSRNILIEEGSWNIPHVSECRFVWEPWGFRYNGGRFRDMPAPLSSSPATAASAEEEDCHPCSRRPEKSKFGIFISPYRQIHVYFTYLLQKHLFLFTLLSHSRMLEELLKLRHFKGIVHPKNLYSVLIYSFQTHMTFFLQWNTKEGILKNVFAYVMKEMVSETHFSKHLLLCSTRKQVLQVWNDMRVNKR